MFVIYNVLLFLALTVALPYYAAIFLVKGKYRRSLGPKLGFVSEDKFRGLSGNPRIWVHAVSVGEVTAAAPIIHHLKKALPEACILVSTGTETGQDMAARIIPEAALCFYLPIDFPWIVKRLLLLVEPRVVVLIETELWPNLLRACHKRGVSVLLVNGRISRRSFKRYLYSRFFWKKVLKCLDGAAMISDIDASRIEEIGMDASKVTVIGNAKFDALAAKVEPRMEAEMKSLFEITPQDTVFVAGSTHDGEESVILDVYRRLLDVNRDILLVIAPRHIDRSLSVLELVMNGGLTDVVMYSALKKGEGRQGRRVVIVDTIGDLFKIYSIATFVFCGGSLVKRGGQNILEPAAWGKVVFYGPSMEDFQEERLLLEGCGAGACVRNGEELYRAVTELIAHPELLRGKGEAGRLAVLKSRGMGKRYADYILTFLQ